MWRIEWPASSRADDCDPAMETYQLTVWKTSLSLPRETACQVRHGRSRLVLGGKRADLVGFPCPVIEEADEPLPGLSVLPKPSSRQVVVQVQRRGSRFGIHSDRAPLIRSAAS